MTAIESRFIETWREAAKDLGFRFSAPFAVDTPDGQRVECIGFVHHFGGWLGTIISVLGQPSSLVHLLGKWESDDYYLSVLGRGDGCYHRQSFIEVLNDWQFFGPHSERPSWYTGEYWGQENRG